MVKELNAKGRKVVQLREKYPDMRASEIGKIVGLTRERVRQILKSQGLSTTVEKPKPNNCDLCGEPVSGDTSRHMKCIQEEAWVIVPCATCGADRKVRSSTHKYRQQNGTHYTGKYYCNRKCFYARPNPFKKET